MKRSLAYAQLAAAVMAIGSDFIPPDLMPETDIESQLETEIGQKTVNGLPSIDGVAKISGVGASAEIKL